MLLTPGTRGVEEGGEESGDNKGTGSAERFRYFQRISKEIITHQLS